MRAKDLVRWKRAVLLVALFAITPQPSAINTVTERLPASFRTHLLLVDLVRIKDLLTDSLTVYCSIEAGPIPGMTRPTFLLDAVK